MLLGFSFSFYKTESHLPKESEVGHYEPPGLGLYNILLSSFPPLFGLLLDRLLANCFRGAACLISDSSIWPYASVSFQHGSWCPGEDG